MCLLSVFAGLATSSSVDSPVLSPVSTKLKSSMSAVNKPQEGEKEPHFLYLHHQWSTRFKVDEFIFGNYYLFINDPKAI